MFCFRSCWIVAWVVVLLWASVRGMLGELWVLCVFMFVSWRFCGVGFVGFTTLLICLVKWWVLDAVFNVSFLGFVVLSGVFYVSGFGVNCLFSRLGCYTL